MPPPSPLPSNAGSGCSSSAHAHRVESALAVAANAEGHLDHKSGPFPVTAISLPRRTPRPQFHLSFILKQLSVPRRRNGTAARRVVANEAQWRGPRNTPSSKNSLSPPHSRLYSFRARLRANRRQHRSRGKEMDG
ncbi:unnamed protein product, partial [Ixodes hexagonus]